MQNVKPQSSGVFFYMHNFLERFTLEYKFIKDHKLQLPSTGYCKCLSHFQNKKVLFSNKPAFITPRTKNKVTRNRHITPMFSHTHSSQKNVITCFGRGNTYFGCVKFKEQSLAYPVKKKIGLGSQGTMINYLKSTA